jgi:glycosyltransferase involved in cell wall biosynthesis
VRLLLVRFSGTPCIAHINVAGRGSTVRKIILTRIARALALRYLLHVHDYDYAGEYCRRGKLMRFLIRDMFGGAAKILVLGAREQQALTSLLRVRPDLISVFHNAVPDPHPGAVTTRRGAPCHLVFLGYLSMRKGVPELLHALARPTLLSLPWRATLAGGGAVDEFRRLAANLGLAERVDFAGSLDRAAAQALCADAEILVMPSHAEGLSMAVLEGLSHGLAVVATPVGAHTEVIEPEVSGLLVPPGDVGALADALARLIDDTTLRNRLRDGARRRFLEKFNVTSYAERMEQLHATLLVGSAQV